jgi:hypothetical protein
MYNTDTEVLFPIRVIPSLRTARGEDWACLIDEVTSEPGREFDRLAFVLLMVRLGGCVNCNTDSFRAMRGCTQCARQTIRRFRGSENDLIDQYKQALEEVEKYYSGNNES